MRVLRNTVEFGYKDSFDYSTITNIIQNWLINHRKVVAERWEDGDKTVGVSAQYIPNDADFIDKIALEKAHQLRLKDLDLMIEAWSIDDCNLDEYESFADWREAQVMLHEARKQGRVLFVENIENLWW